MSLDVRSALSTYDPPVVTQLVTQPRGGRPAKSAGTVGVLRYDAARREELFLSMTKADREALLSSWIKPSSDSEKEQQDRAERMVRDAIKAWPAFEDVSLAIYTKGSYPNNTNVRADSDVDVVVECLECFYFDYAHGVTGNPGVGSRYEGGWTKERWREEVGNALIKAFGEDDIDLTGKVAQNVAAVKGSRPSADVVPSFNYYRYLDGGRNSYYNGSCVFDTSGKKIVNWPDQQLKNGRKKNTDTGKSYKRFVRALKRCENKLVGLGRLDELPSYFMECLVWNVANPTLCIGDDLQSGFRATLVELWGALEDGSAEANWKEPNELKWLFKGDKKWSVDDGTNLVLETWRFLEYGS